MIELGDDVDGGWCALIFVLLMVDKECNGRDEGKGSNPSRREAVVVVNVVFDGSIQLHHRTAIHRQIAVRIRLKRYLNNA
jgi:hypothetical protein